MVLHPAFSPASFSTFPPQTHDHSVCIRPPLPAFSVTSQNAVFQLEGSFVSFSVLSQVWWVDGATELLHVPHQNPRCLVSVPPPLALVLAASVDPSR